MSLKKFKIDKVIDKTDNFTTKHPLFDLPFRLLFIAKTGDSKSTNLLNYFVKEEGYKNHFEPEQIFIFSGSLDGDFKIKTMIEELEIPIQNTFDNYDNDIVNIIYDMLVERYNENIENGIKDPKKLNSVFIFDDLAYNNSFKSKGKDDAIRRIFFNGRKFLVSILIITQKLSGSLDTSIRENASGIIFGKSSNKQLEILEKDANYLTGKNAKKRFYDMVRKATDEPYSKFIVNYSKKHLYFNENMEELKY